MQQQLLSFRESIFFLLTHFSRPQYHETQRANITLHGNQWPHPTCAFCHARFTSTNALTLHSRQHGPDRPAFVCWCGVKFTRLDALKRHCKAKDITARIFHCSLCTKHRGDKGFARRDHLQQHLTLCHKGEGMASPIRSDAGQSSSSSSGF